MGETDLITAKEVARMFSIGNRWSLNDYIKNGVVPRPVMMGKSGKRFVRSECEEAVRRLKATRDKKAK